MCGLWVSLKEPWLGYVRRPQHFVLHVCWALWKVSVAGSRPFLQLSLACYLWQINDAGWSWHMVNLQYHAFKTTLSRSRLFVESTFIGSHKVCVLLTFLVKACKFLILSLRCSACTLVYIFCIFAQSGQMSGVHVQRCRAHRTEASTPVGTLNHVCGCSAFYSFWDTFRPICKHTGYDQQL